VYKEEGGERRKTFRGKTLFCLRALPGNARLLRELLPHFARGLLPPGFLLRIFFAFGSLFSCFFSFHRAY
jgi:hypothetical protein